MASSHHSLGFQRFRRTVHQRATFVARNVAQQLAETIVTLTPEDTSNAENNWDAALNTVPQQYDDTRRSPGGEEAINRAVQIAEQLRIGDSFALANSAPYIFRLENGWSQQAPNGMRDITTAMFQRMVEQAARRARTGL
jgi:hypothetical protein